MMRTFVVIILFSVYLISYTNTQRPCPVTITSTRTLTSTQTSTLTATITATVTSTSILNQTMIQPASTVTMTSTSIQLATIFSTITEPPSIVTITTTPPLMSFATTETVSVTLVKDLDPTVTILSSIVGPTVTMKITKCDSMTNTANSFQHLLFNSHLAHHGERFRNRTFFPQLLQHWKRPKQRKSGKL